MKPSDLLYCCSFKDSSADPSIAPELLSALEFDFSSRLDAESGETVHTLYFQDKASSENARDQIENMREIWAELGVTFGDILLSELKKEDWAESWKIHFKPMVISPNLAIAPSWSGFQPEAGQKLVTLDPGMSFGTGQHATTKFCLKQLDTLAVSGIPEGAAMLDAGCGSGILAIAAAKLGWSRVDAFDIDPDCVTISKENAAMNGISSIHFSAAPLLEFNPGEGDSFQYDVIAANILSSALLAGKEKLFSMLKPGGILILAGIMDSEYGIVRNAFESLGCVQFDSAEESSWRGGIFRKN